MLLHKFCIDEDGGVVKRVLSTEEKAVACEELEKWLDRMTGKTEEHADAMLGMADDSVPEKENMHLEEKSRTRASLVQLLRMKSKLPPDYVTKTWLEIAQQAPQHFVDSDGSEEDDDEIEGEEESNGKSASEIESGSDSIGRDSECDEDMGDAELSLAQENPLEDVESDLKSDKVYRVKLVSSKTIQARQRAFLRDAMRRLV